MAHQHHPRSGHAGAGSPNPPARVDPGSVVVMSRVTRWHRPSASVRALSRARPARRRDRGPTRRAFPVRTASPPSPSPTGRRPGAAAPTRHPLGCAPTTPTRSADPPPPRPAAQRPPTRRQPVRPTRTDAALL